MSDYQPVSALLAHLESQGMRFWLADDQICHDGPSDLAQSDDFKQIMARVWETIDTLEVAARPTLPPLVPQRRPLRIPLAPQQEAFFGAAHDPRFAGYSYAYKIRGAIDAKALQRALETLVERHESLRTIYPSDKEGVYAKVRDDCSVNISRQSLRSTAAAELDQAIAARLEGFRAASFDLQNGPLFRCQLLELAPAESILQLVFHFIATDPFAQYQFSQDIADAYNAVRAGRAPKLPRPDLQYADYAIWMRNAQETFDAASTSFDWAHALKDAPPPSFQRPAPDAATKRVAVRFPEGFQNQLLDFALQYRTFIGPVLNYALGALLARRSKLLRTSIGMTFTNRPTECSSMVGSFVVSKPLIIDISNDPTGAEFAARARRAFKTAHDLTNPISYELVQAHKLSAVHSYFGRAEKFGEVLPAPQLDGLQVEALPSQFPRWSSRFYAEFVETVSEIKGRISYTDGVFSDEAARELAEDLPVFLDRLVKTPNARLSTLWP